MSPTLRKVLFDQLQKRRDGLREVKHSLMTAKRGAGLGAGCLGLQRSAPGAAGLEPAARMLSILTDHVTGAWSVLTKRGNSNWS